MRLSREDFSDALRKGKGRAYQYVRENGDSGVEDILIDACLRDLAYDPQLCGCRASWLVDIVDQTKNPALYYDSIIGAFMGTRDTWDVRQQSGFLGILAKRSYVGARKILYQKYDLQEFRENWLIGEDIIRLDGIEGMLYIADVVGRRIAKDPSYQEDNLMIDSYCENLDKERVAESLRSTALNNPNIKAYVDSVIATSGCLFHDENNPWYKPSPKEILTLRQFLEILEAGDAPRGRYFGFGRDASSKDLREIFSLLSLEKDREKILRYLWTFRWVGFPEVSELILSYASSSDDNIRQATLLALSSKEDALTRHLALQQLDRGNLEVLTLFISNYSDGDFPRIYKKLHLSFDQIELHSICRDILDICRNHNCLEAAACLIWVYENTPCSGCRGTAVAKLVSTRSLPDVLTQECFFDCEDDTRALVRAGGFLP